MLLSPESKGQPLRAALEGRTLIIPQTPQAGQPETGRRKKHSFPSHLPPRHKKEQATREPTVPAAAESRNRAKPHRAAEGSWSIGPPPRGGISGDNSHQSQGWSGGGSPEGADVPRLSQLPPLALIRSRFSATSAVNACVDGAKPTAGIVPDVGRYASFSGLRKKVQHERQ